MSLHLVICENGLKRDENALRVLLGDRDLRVIPLDGGETLSDRSARLVKREFERQREERLVLVVHRDADTEPWRRRRARVVEWFKEQRLSRFARALVPVVPDPCIERWLCLGAGLTARARGTVRPCDPWKRSWEQPRPPEHLRLPDAMRGLLARPPEDLQQVLADLAAVDASSPD